jgi:hypothetical protein
MDPLSVIASVVGLLAAGAKIASLLSKTASLANAPGSVQAVLTEMREISGALQYLQQFLNSLTVKERNTQTTQTTQE